MTNVLLVIHLMLAIAMIMTVLLQRSEGGGLGIGGGGGGGMGSFLSGRSTANLLTRITAILAAGFMVTSLTLTILAASDRAPRSILDTLPVTGTPSPVPGTAPGTAPAPGDEQPARPSVPVQ
ncbi:MAG TPA: preprotein translocase subunit SecG [Kiloniellales bacterium]|jgi:preprotein translocase subunit SecG